jgi:branched-chain amino acid aminotransferase
VHRGDGVFETIKIAGGALYAVDAHLRRLEASAACIGLRSPWPRAQLAECLRQTAQAGGRRDALARVILSRGPGSFGVNPYDCPEPQLYIVIYKASPSFMDAHPDGARVIDSVIPVKPSFFATIKTCNYLPNALMKKEAVDAGVNFSLAFDEDGRLAEGATENAGIVTADNVLRLPPPHRILDGITMQRAEALAHTLVDDGLLAGVERAHADRHALKTAREIMIFGTTPDVTSVVLLNGQPVGDGRPGPIQGALNALLRDDIQHNQALRTPLFEPET